MIEQMLWGPAEEVQKQGRKEGGKNSECLEPKSNYSV